MPRRTVRSLILLLLAVAGVQAVGGDAGPALPAMTVLAGPAGPADLDVMTFNLRYASDIEPNSWAQRRPVMGALLRAEQPDLISTQEGLAAQLRDIDADLGTRYDRIGVGRQGGERDEHMAIYYDTTRLRPQHSGNFWLSETPQLPGSISWDAFRTRMVTWGLFTDVRTGRRFYAVNTHLDNRSETARRHGARLVMDRLAGFEPLPVVLTGDFNNPAEPSSPVYRMLTGEAGLRDTWTSAPRRGPQYSTLHNFGPPARGGARIDWILTTPAVTVVAVLANTHHQDDQYPSDHLPVQARLRLP